MRRGKNRRRIFMERGTRKELNDISLVAFSIRHTLAKIIDCRIISSWMKRTRNILKGWGEGSWFSKMGGRQ